MDIRQATPADLDLVTPLFDGYRQFYRQTSDLPLCREFIADRLRRKDAVIFLAQQDGQALGFVQLYPAFSSTAGRPGRSWLLNDLYVVPEARGRGVGRALMERARRLGEETGARSIELATEADNRTAQALYESLGYRRDEVWVYGLTLGGGQPG